MFVQRQRREGSLSLASSTDIWRTTVDVKLAGRHDLVMCCAGVTINRHSVQLSQFAVIVSRSYDAWTADSVERSAAACRRVNRIYVALTQSKLRSLKRTAFFPQLISKLLYTGPNCTADKSSFVSVLAFASPSPYKASTRLKGKWCDWARIYRWIHHRICDVSSVRETPESQWYFSYENLFSYSSSLVRSRYFVVLV